jgi:hypothetical protein
LRIFSAELRDLPQRHSVCVPDITITSQGGGVDITKNSGRIPIKRKRQEDKVGKKLRTSGRSEVVPSNEKSG